MRKWMTVACAGLFTVSGCAYLGQVSPDDIKVKVLDVDVGVPRSGGLPLNFRVLLTNFSGATQKIQAVTYRLRVNEEQFLSGDVTTPIVLEQNAQTEVELPLQVNYESIGKTLKSLVRLTKSRYALEGDVVVDSILGDVRVPFHREGEIGPAGLE